MGYLIFETHQEHVHLVRKPPGLLKREGVPYFIICCKNLMMTLELGRIRTWRLPRFSALKILRRQSLSTETRTIWSRRESLVREAGRTGRADWTESWPCQRLSPRQEEKKDRRRGSMSNPHADCNFG